jgi:hydrogenase 3 maturation protease
VVLDCGTISENYTSVVKRYKPKTLVLIDAADMDLATGDARIIPKEKFGEIHISIHGMPLSVFITYLEPEADHTMVLVIQPNHMSGIMYIAVKKMVIT